MWIKDIQNIINTIFPEKFQEKYDNSGPQVFFQEEEVSNIIFSLDIDAAIIHEALSRQCNLIITHHPLLFKQLKSIDSAETRSKTLISLIQNKISLYALHTNLDKFYFDKLSHFLGYTNTELLIPTDVAQTGHTIGFGTIARLEQPITLQELLATVKEKLGVELLPYCGDTDWSIKNIAIINGAGGRQIEQIISSKSVDCIITGDVGYHEIKYAFDSSIAVIDAGHYGSEKILLHFLQSELQDYLTKMSGGRDIQLYISENETNPFKYF